MKLYFFFYELLFLLILTLIRASTIRPSFFKAQLFLILYHTCFLHSKNNFINIFNRQFFYNIFMFLNRIRNFRMESILISIFTKLYFIWRSVNSLRFWPVQMLNLHFFYFLKFRLNKHFSWLWSAWRLFKW